MTAEDMTVPGREESPRLAAWLDRVNCAAEGRLLGRGYQAAAWLLDSPIGPVVVKAARGSGVVGRAGRRALRREAEIYRRLAGVPGIPRSFGLINEQLVLEHIDGPSLRRYEKQLVDRERFFERLLRTLEAMHEAGIAHGDLKRKDNLLVGPGEQPYVIDFGIAWRVSVDSPRWRRIVFDLVQQMDYNAWIKLKYRRDVSRLSAADAERYRPLLLERAARAVRIPWQKATLRRVRKRRQRERRG